MFLALPGSRVQHKASGLMGSVVGPVPLSSVPWGDYTFVLWDEPPGLHFSEGRRSLMTGETDLKRWVTNDDIRKISPLEELAQAAE